MNIEQVIYLLFGECQTISECSTLCNRIEKLSREASGKRKNELKTLDIDEIMNFDISQFGRYVEAYNESKEEINEH